MKQVLLAILLFANVIVLSQTGIGTTTPDPSAQLDVSSTDKGLLPPRMTEAEKDAISSPTDGLVVYQTDGAVGLYLRKSGAWVMLSESQNLSVSATGDTLSLLNGGSIIIPGISLANGSPPSIGDYYQGGIVFYLDGNGGGLIAAPSDQSPSSIWCIPTTFGCASGTDIGDGFANTSCIEYYCTTPNTAADVCANLTLNGYSDWFLPSEDELNQMYLNIGMGNALGLGNIGNFAYEYYWSSSYNYSSGSAISQNFGNGYGQWAPVHSNYFHVRAVRAF